MKLCFIAVANSIHSYRWIKYFAEQGHEITWVSLAPNQYDPIPGVNYVEIPFRLGPVDLFKAWRRLRDILRESRPDLLHVHYLGVNGLLAAWTGFRPLVATAWGSDVIYNKRSWLKRTFVRQVLRRASLVTCDALHMRKEMADLGVDAGKIHIINFGIDTQRFHPRPRSAEIRRKLGVGDAMAVISLRNFEPVYDIPTLLRAIPLVLRKCPGTRFVIVGRGSLEQELKALAEHLGVAEHATFVGYIPNQELPDYLSSMDVYVSTSLSDAGISSSTAEAMACGLPVVVTDSGENAAWITDRVNGRIVPVSNPERLAEGIVYLLEDAERRRSMAALGRQTIQERNDYHVEMNKMQALYARVAAGQ